MLSNAYFLAKFRFDTAENEPAKNLQKFANFPNFANPNPCRPSSLTPSQAYSFRMAICQKTPQPAAEMSGDEGKRCIVWAMSCTWAICKKIKYVQRAGKLYSARALL